jgi:hypothetical protein
VSAKTALTLLGAFLVCISAAPARAAADPAPSWQIFAYADPTVFEPGAVGVLDEAPGVHVAVQNAGGAPASGAFVIKDVLPQGIVPSPSRTPVAFYGPEQAKVHFGCNITGRTVSCATTGTVYPGELVNLAIPVQVSAQAAPGAVLDRATIEGGGAAAASTFLEVDVATTPAPFGFVDANSGAYGVTRGEDGAVVTGAGSHPEQLSLGMSFNLEPAKDEAGDTLHVPGGGLRAISATLPQGVVVDPSAASKCTEAELETPYPNNGNEIHCPLASQVGTVVVRISLSSGIPIGSVLPLYNMVPPPGTPAELGFEIIEGAYIHLLGKVDSTDRFRLGADVSSAPANLGVAGAEVNLWGDPSAASHDHVRSYCASGGGDCALAERSGKAFLSMPSACGAPLETTLGIENWIGERPGASFALADGEGNAFTVDGCNRLAFEPSIEAEPTTDVGDSPSGLEFNLHQVQHEGHDELSTASLKNATVTLPEGMALNPSAANGREACSSSQVGVTTAPGIAPIGYSEDPASCPQASKVGSAEVTTPLLREGPEGNPFPHKLHGSVYLAKPFDNPFDSLLAIYLVIEDEQTGIIAKLAGKVEGDPTTGLLTTRFEESPELPLEDIALHFFGGARGVLTTPLTCGTHVTTSTLTPWSTPEGSDADPSDSFQLSTGCSASESTAPKTASFTAGTESPISGAYSPFVLRLARPDGSQHITGIETTLPEGLLGRLAGISYCPESGIAQAISREAPEKGKEEISSPSCPSSSEVGTVDVTAGSGITPIPVSGHAYLAGPYKGAPLSLVVIVPAVAGPFDLGTVVDRVALNVGEYDARIHAVADPLPTIRDGIPLDVRSIELKLERPGFTLNPTSCEAMAIEGSVSTQAGQSTPLKNSFQVGECGRLGFKPKLSISLKGGTKRAAHPALKAVVTYPKKGEYANIARAQVSLPHSEFLDQGNIGNTCTKPALAAHACPAKSIYGKVKAWTPLLEKPLEGEVYLVGGYGYKLPAMVAELSGQIRVLLVGKVDTDKEKGIRNTFEAVPDAPIEKFVLELRGGKKYGLLVNSENICKKKQVAGALFTAQNGKTLSLSPVIANSCKSGPKKNKKAAKGKGKHRSNKKTHPKKH